MSTKVNNSKKIFVTNIILISAIFVLNYFYQSNGFDFTLKCICSGGFALLGIINLVYVVVNSKYNIKFSLAMAIGLLFAFLGDVLIGYDFIIGAAIFAIGHICFVAAYCRIQKITGKDLSFSIVLFAGVAVFLLFCPWLTFDEPIFKIVCLVYAFIISTMLGKAIGNFISNRNYVTGTIATASILFCFSDLMLVFDCFIGHWDWTDNACMGSYYPALCMLAFSVYLKAISDERV